MYKQEKKISTRKKLDQGIWNFSKIPRKISEEREKEEERGEREKGKVSSKRFRGR